jgi:hypothetical protein
MVTGNSNRKHSSRSTNVCCGQFDDSVQIIFETLGGLDMTNAAEAARRLTSVTGRMFFATSFFTAQNVAMDELRRCPVGTWRRANSERHQRVMPIRLKTCLQMQTQKPDSTSTVGTDSAWKACKSSA